MTTTSSDGKTVTTTSYDDDGTVTGTIVTKTVEINDGTKVTTVTLETSYGAEVSLNDEGTIDSGETPESITMTETAEGIQTVTEFAVVSVITMDDTSGTVAITGGETLKATGMTTTSSDGKTCLLYTSPSPRDKRQSRMPSSA